jgi:hypothetical protein
VGSAFDCICLDCGSQRTAADSLQYQVGSYCGSFNKGPAPLERSKII